MTSSQPTAAQRPNREKCMLTSRDLRSDQASVMDERAEWPMPVDAFLKDAHLYLKRCDVVLCSGRSVFSRLIKWATKSVFSHAALVFLIPDKQQGFDNTFILESNSKGVDLTNLRLCLLRTPSTAQSLTFPHSGSSYPTPCFTCCMPWSRARARKPRLATAAGHCAPQDQTPQAVQG
jgi:hypothetical protein